MGRAWHQRGSQLRILARAIAFSDRSDERSRRAGCQGACAAPSFHRVSPHPGCNRGLHRTGTAARGYEYGDPRRRTAPRNSPAKPVVVRDSFRYGSHGEFLWGFGNCLSHQAGRTWPHLRLMPITRPKLTRGMLHRARYVPAAILCQVHRDVAAIRMKTPSYHPTVFPAHLYRSGFCDLPDTNRNEKHDSLPQ